MLTRKSDVGLSSNVSSKTSSSVKIALAVKKPVGGNPKPLNKKNVMNTVHNVTIASPPSSASKERSASIPNLKAGNHSRSRTRTIPPEESILLKQNSLNLENVKVVEHVKNPVSFEINFEDAKIEKPTLNEKVDDEYDYESDFESYESDFEAEVPSSSESEGSEKSEKPSNATIRVDSGNFELSVKKSTSSAQLDSIDDTINSHDSGISYEDLNAISRRVLSPRVHEFYKRGEELMKKITFDELKFDIFEAKPIPYELFMSVYGQRNMTQASTQSESLQAVDEVQTDPIYKSEAWTQFPAKFTKAGLEVVNSKLYNEEKIGVGEGISEVLPENDNLDSLSQTIDAINSFSKSEENYSRKSEINFNSNDLQRFVENAAITMENLLDNQSKAKELSPSKISISRGYTNLKFTELSVLKDTKLTNVFTNLNVQSLVVTIHEKKDLLQNLMCLWDVTNTKRPLKVFKSWSKINCIEIHANQRDILIGGCSDGTICLWDSQECFEWINDFEDSFTIKPSEIISLNNSVNDFSLDNVVALKSLPHHEIKNSSMFSHSQATQICSLHKSGAVIIWTISRSENGIESVKKSEMDFVDSKSRLRLMKNLVIDLNVAVEKKEVRRKSAFEKTRYYFENDLFSDKVLKELQEIDSSRMGKEKTSFGDEDLMRFNDCAVTLNEILIASDSNFILALSRLNLGSKSRKILTNHSSVISPTVIKIHPRNQNVLAVGQTNGEVKFVQLYDSESFHTSSSAKHARKSNDSNLASDVLSKSCAFQNIVEKEKRLYDVTQAMNNRESDELKTFLVNEALAEQFDECKENLKVSFNKNIFNSFEVSPGSVKSIEFNKTGEFMFVLIGKKLRIFNCWSNSEVDHQEKSNFCDVACVQSADSSEYLVNYLKTFKEFSIDFFSIFTDFDDQRK